LGPPSYREVIAYYLFVGGKTLIVQVSVVYVIADLPVIGSAGNINGGIGYHSLTEEFFHAIVEFPGVTCALKFRECSLDGSCGSGIGVWEGPLVINGGLNAPTGGSTPSKARPPGREEPAKGLVETVPVLPLIIGQ